MDRAKIREAGFAIADEVNDEEGDWEGVVNVLDSLSLWSAASAPPHKKFFVLDCQTPPHCLLQKKL